MPDGWISSSKSSCGLSTRTPAGADQLSPWRQLLPALDGLPLLPCGWGNESKGPMLEAWQSAAFTPQQIAAMNGAVRCVGTRTGSDAGGLVSFDIDGATALELALEQNCDPQQARTWQIHRSTDPCRLKVNWRLSVPQQQQIGELSTKATTKPPPRDANGDVLRAANGKPLKGEAVEVFHHPGRQIIVLGEHVTSGGHYLWPDGRGPEALAPIPPNWWQLLLKIKAGELGIPTPTAAPRAPGARRRARGEWQSLVVCPICGRDTTGYCSKHRNRGTVRCFHGSTFNPTYRHSLDRRGVLVQGSDGIAYGYCGTRAQGNGDQFSVFVVHQDRPVPEGPTPSTRTHRKDTSDTEPQAGGDGPQPGAGSGQPRAATPAEKLARLQEQAAALLATKTAYASRMPLLRAMAEDLGVTMRDGELLGLLKAARRQRLHGCSDGILGPGDVLDTTPEPWAWEGLVLRGCLNLWVALPKVGKTALALAFLAAWHRNEPAFLDRDLMGRCPPVLIVGNDQGQADWGRMLQAVGWLDTAGRIGDPVIGLAHAGRPLHLDPEGIDRIGEIAQAHPGLIVLIDSLHASVAPLGLKEESPEIAEPIADLMELVEPHGATVILIHHASKGRAGDGASSASRGSTALPALASQTLKLGPATSTPHDHRRLLTTEGRGGMPQSLVIEREGASWTLHGGAEVLEQERKAADTLEAIRKNERKADTLDLVMERWQDGYQRTGAGDVVAGLQLRGKDPAGSALRTLKQLERAGVVQSIQRSAEQGKGRSYEFWPTELATTDTPRARAHVGAAKSPPVVQVVPVVNSSREDPEQADTLQILTTCTTGTTGNLKKSPTRGGAQPAGCENHAFLPGDDDPAWGPRPQAVS